MLRETENLVDPQSSAITLESRLCFLQVIQVSYFWSFASFKMRSLVAICLEAFRSRDDLHWGLSGRQRTGDRQSFVHNDASWFKRGGEKAKQPTKQGKESIFYQKHKHGH